MQCTPHTFSLSFGETASLDFHFFTEKGREEFWKDIFIGHCYICIPTNKSHCQFHSYKYIYIVDELSEAFESESIKYGQLCLQFTAYGLLYDGWAIICDWFHQSGTRGFAPQWLVEWLPKYLRPLWLGGYQLQWSWKCYWYCERSVEDSFIKRLDS